MAAPLEPPGSVVYSLSPQERHANWQRLATVNPASRPLQQMAYLSSLGVDSQ